MVYRGRKQLLIAGAIYVLGVVIVTAIWIRFLQFDTLRAIDDRLRTAAREMPSLLADDFHDRATSANSISREEDLSNLDILSSHARLGGFAYLYTYILKNDQIFFTSSSFDDEDIQEGTVSYYWTPYPEGDQAYFDALNASEPVFVTASDRWGTFRTILVPSHAKNGQKYVVGIDMDISEIESAMWRQIPWIIGAAFLLLAFAGPIALNMRRTLEKINLDLRQLNTALELDLAERERVEHELRAATEKANVANESKSRFLANMSHEMRTPLNGVTGMTDLLLDTPLEPTQREYAQRIQQCSQALLETIHHVLDVASIESGHARFQYRSIDLRDWIDQHSSVFSLPLARQQIDLAFEVANRVPAAVQIDPERLWQILGNLIGNAIKYTERGGVHVFIDWHDHALHIRVEDTGIGIPTEQQGMIFDAFAQADTSRTRRYEGSGLGLTLARDLCRLMGGKLWLERSTPLGSLFCFRVPAGADEAAPTHFSVKPSKRITVVTDFIATVQHMEFVLNPLGISVHRLNDIDALLKESLDGKSQALIIDSKYGSEALAMAANRIPKEVILIWMQWLGESVPETSRSDVRRLSKPLTSQALKLALSALLPHSQQQEVIEGTVNNSQLTSAKVLVVEDNEVNQMIIMRMLALAGMHAEAVNNGLDAVLAVREQNFDLVLMDIQMPQLDGLQATQMILAEKGEDAPIIVGLSAHATLDQIEEARAAGMQEYLTKPIRRDTLLSTLQKVLSASRV